MCWCWISQTIDGSFVHRRKPKCASARPDEPKQAIHNGKMRLRKTMISAGCGCADPIPEFSGL